MAGVKEEVMKYKVVRAVRMYVSLQGDDPKAENGYSISKSRHGLFWKPVTLDGEKAFFRTWASAVKFAAVLEIRDTPIKEDECKPTS